MLNQLANHQYQIDEAMVLHFMGYRNADQVSAPILDTVRKQLPLVRQFTDQWGTAVEVPISHVSKQEVVLQKQTVGTPGNEAGEIVLRSKKLPNVLQHCDAVVILLVTAGTEISATAKRTDDPLDAFVIDALGSAMVVELMKTLTRTVFTAAQQRRYGTTLRMGPGYTGWHIDDQVALAGCFDHESIPVRFEPGAMMRPEKTLLGLTGLKPGGRQAPEIEPCRVCDLPDCRMRRFEFRGAPG